ncbi:MAG: sulfurtransferase [Rhodospirillaceae bacterium]|nr:MAG: sulfurtransferase [Rhodospirillaceae bacterium]
MSIDRLVFAIAGFLVLLSLALGILIHPYWFFLAAFVGFNMFQASFTGFCPLAKVLKRLGAKSGCAFQ